jgi:ligand-binding sensor domain-containing protein
MTLRFDFRILIIILLSWVIKGMDCAYGQALSFDHLTREEGLSQSTVLAMTQDSKGFMWFGTREGLNRYDARTIKVYRNHPLEPTSLSDNFVYSLFYDSRDRLWIGTRAGLNLFDSKSESFKDFIPIRKIKRPSPIMRSPVSWKMTGTICGSVPATV